MIIRLNALLYIFTIFLASCNFIVEKKIDFYSYTKSWDLWRVPLIEPFEIISPTNMGADDWFLILKKHNIEGTNFVHQEDEFQLSSIQTIGILDSVIVATNEDEYWPKLSGQYPSTLIIDMKTNEQFIYSNQHHTEELEEKLKLLNIEAIKMLDWNKIRTNFLENLTLPDEWNEQRLHNKQE